ncbi:hypothetical protein Acr_17g0007980 [Actinidia rufa]|uniref:Retrotransposon gag domain-containing protein n=1 Tax=Actinidia rufa TaxID=165716 RepID=A0A7J0G359_9ERIC|nr:hypothetical protein Acr_17g0007980 [Actinidia rufa]
MADLESRFTQGNNATIFKLQREITNIQQGNLDITNYYNNIKTLWDQLDAIDPLPECTCGTAKAWQKRVSNRRVYQFLMGLDESYHVSPHTNSCHGTSSDLGKVHGLLISEEHTKTPKHVDSIHPSQEESAMVSYRHQIQPQSIQTQQWATNEILKDSVFLKAHSHEILTLSQHNSADNHKQSAAAVNPPRQPINTQAESTSRPIKDPNAHCTHCNRGGHYKSGCFKIIGYPDWFYNRLSNRSPAQLNYAGQTSARESQPRIELS